MLRKPQLFVNYIPFMINDFSAWAANSFYITKKIFDHKKNRYLNLKEISALKYNIHQEDFFENQNLQVIDNTDIEIYKAISEMYDRCQNTWIDSEEQNNLQNQFLG